MKFFPIDRPTLSNEHTFARVGTRGEDKFVRIISNWVRNYLCEPHSRLGRTGPVCPFTAPAVELGQIWVAIAPKSNDTIDSVAQASLEGRQFFQNAPEDKSQSKDYKAVLILFPHLNTYHGHTIIESVQRILKPDFMAMGLMFGQFYQGCPEPGLSNPMFRPLFSPIPLLAIRYIVKLDIAFLQQDPTMLKYYHTYFPESRDTAAERVAS